MMPHVTSCVLAFVVVFIVLVVAGVAYITHLRTCAERALERVRTRDSLASRSARRARAHLLTQTMRCYSGVPIDLARSVLQPPPPAAVGGGARALAHRQTRTHTLATIGVGSDTAALRADIKADRVDTLFIDGEALRALRVTAEGGVHVQLIPASQLWAGMPFDTYAGDSTMPSALRKYMLARGAGGARAPAPVAVMNIFAFRAKATPLDVDTERKT